MLRHRRYESREVLGRGAQGVVVRVVDREDPSRALVAKVWKASRSGEWDALAAEFALLSRLRLAGLVRAHDWARDEKTRAPFFVEDFADGPDACEHVRAAKTPDERARRITAILVDLAATLGALHAAGFVHGDVKPAHVRVTASGTKLLDLGCAVTHGARSRGLTEKYAAPELLASGAASPRADLYALGALALDLGPLPPSLRAIADALHARDPEARPASAYDVLAMLGRSADLPAGARPAPIGREDALAFVLDRNGAKVRYVTGPAGAGKTHLLEEARLASLLGGRNARLVDARGPHVAQLVAFFRGNAEAWPFASSPREPTLVLVDDLHRASELGGALIAYACRAADVPVRVVASTEKALPHGATFALGALDGAAFEALCKAVGVSDVAAMRAASEGIPGVVVAASGRVPLSRDAVLARVRDLTEDESLLFAALALTGGIAPRELPRALFGEGGEAALSRLIALGLVTRSPDVVSLFALPLAADIASALGSCARVDRVADACLAITNVAPSALLALARGTYPPTRRAALLEHAAALARSIDSRGEEIDALRDLARDPASRSLEMLVRLERLLRDAGRAAEHADVVSWLLETKNAGAAKTLAMRRKAESAARSGRRDEALALAHEAAASAEGDVAGALALATLGAVHLYASDWTRAEDALVRARAVLASATLDDREELARLDHNLGVASLVRGDLDRAIDALERSLRAKRASSDLAGVRSSLLNLGIAYGKARRFDDARRSLDEALALAKTLGQRAGSGWCLVALCDLEVKRGDVAAARRFASEAETLLDALPSPIRADLALALAEAELIEGKGDAARAHVATIDTELRRDDALIDARCDVTLGRASLATLPSDKHAAARLAVTALRRGRAAGLAEIEQPARALLRAARGMQTRWETTMAPNHTDDELWTAAERAATAATSEEAARAILDAVIRMSGAERALLGRLDGAGQIADAWGLDVDGLTIASAAERITLDGTGTSVRYIRDVELHGRRGSRMSVVRGSPAIVLVVEQRFVAGAFDALPASVLERAATLAALAVRASPEHAIDVEAPEAGVAPSGSTTVLPVREARRAFPAILGSSRALDRALARLDAAIETDLPVLVLGETGTGKELFARALHDQGRRSRAPLVALNCAAVPEALFEAELFGHVRGAFTGADRARPGLLARAEGGTLFLDELGDLALSHQAALLRALETGRYRPVGSDEEREFDVRIVAATHRDLAASAKAGTFRSDLLFRLAVLEIKVPALREREGDVALLARHFLDHAGGGELTPRALEAIVSYAWPGNVRELSHYMQRLAALRSPRIDWQHLPRELRTAHGTKPVPLDERGQVARALAETGGNISHAAVRLGITRHGLKKRMLRLGMRSKS